MQVPIIRFGRGLFIDFLHTLLIAALKYPQIDYITFAEMKYTVLLNM